MKGLFIAFEGGDASGKTTQAQLVADRLDAVFTREPGGTALGETLRDLVLEPDAHVDLRAEALLIAAARAQHVNQVIRPAIEAGRHVVTDRFVASSLVYQGIGSGLGIDEIRSINEFATAGLCPDVTVLIDVPVEIAQQRLGGPPDRFEREEDGFHQSVRRGYLALAAGDDSWLVIDGSGAIEEVTALVGAALDGWFASPPPGRLGPR